MPRVREILEAKGRNVVTASPDDSVLDAAEKMNEARIGAVCVVNGAKVVGMFSERDILCRIVAERRDPTTTRVSEVMTAPVVTCGPDAKLEHCWAVMSQKKIRHLPVVDGDGDSGDLVGMISTGDLMAREVEDQQGLIEHMHEYLHGRA